MARLPSLLILLAACSNEPSKLDGFTLGPHIKLDGEWDEPQWNSRAQRYVLTGDDGEQARPYSEIRFLRDDTYLIIGTYAADEDIRSTDAFELTFKSRGNPGAEPPDVPIKLYANGRAEPATVRAGVDRDGTIDDPSGGDDEEWVIEAAVPLADLGPAPLHVTAKRCDVTKDGVRRCGSWQGTIDPAKLPR